jgi:hypothetical protein
LVIVPITDMLSATFFQRRPPMPTLTRLLPLALLVLLTACSSEPVLSPITSRLPERVELSDVPFFPQNAFQSAPAAMASMLLQRGVNTDPGLLKDRVYIAGRDDMRPALVATAEAHDMLVYPLQPTMDALLGEVAAGNPVLVLQNVGMDMWPDWHYAVVVGYDLHKQTLTLRSGGSRRLQSDFAAFEKSWKSSERWAVLTLPANLLPASAQRPVWLKAAAELKEAGRADAAQRAYRAAAERWPEQTTSQQ